MPITHLRLPADLPTMPLPFYLSMEEWAARYAPEGEFFFLWQVEPTVIFGRNQQIDKEVNLEYCSQKGIRFYRRKSGGGCVYADMDNIMFSYIAPSTSVQTTFQSYTHRIAEMLRTLGLDAEATGRNDILIEGRKVSGNAFYHIPGRSIVHGTMLFSTNMENMLNAITPSKSKLESKKVKSVDSHITTISRHLPTLDIEEFKAIAIRNITDNELTLSQEDINKIKEIAEPYYTHRWIYGREAANKNFSISTSQRIEGAGEFTLFLTLDGAERISDINLQGDFFVTADVDSLLLTPLKGVSLNEKDLKKALKNTDPGSIIPGLQKSSLLSLILSAK